MADATSLGLVVGSAALINEVYAVQKGHDAVIPLVGSGVMYVGLTIVGGITGKWELPVAFAWVFLLASLIGRGIPLMQSASKLANAKSSGNAQGGGGGGR